MTRHQRRLLKDHLSSKLTGPVYTSGKPLATCSRDFSIYAIEPAAVVVPHGIDDVLAVLAVARQEGLPVTARGGGSSTAGSPLGEGIVLWFGRDCPLGSIALDEEAGPDPHVVAGAAALHDDVQKALGDHGRFLPADPSSGSMSYIGGNVVTKASGPHALKHGSIDRYLEGVTLVLPDGRVIEAADDCPLPADLVAGLARIRNDIVADGPACTRIRQRHVTKCASGYNLGALLEDGAPGRQLARLVAGSVGSLGVVMDATLRSELRPEGRLTSLLYFRDLHEAGAAVMRIRAAGAAAIEIMNARTVEMIRERRPDVELPADPAHVLLVEYTGADRYDEVDPIAGQLSDFTLAAPPLTVEDPEQQAYLWRVRKSLLPLLRQWKPGYKALSVVNDIGVAPGALADVLVEVQSVFDDLKMPVAIYGHAGSGNLHLRPLFDIEAPDLPTRIRTVADRIYDVVFAHDGTITAEHGMGPIRAPYLEREWGSSIYQYMQRVKRLFDPEGLLNPGVMFSNAPITRGMAPLELLR